MRIIISKEYAGELLRTFIQKELHLSSKMLRHIKFTPGGITANGNPCTVRYRLQEGDVLMLATEDTESAPHLTPVALPIEILYEDDDLVIPSKPANMPTHPSHDHHDDTVANALAYRYTKSGTPFIFRPINRLDRNTSGLLLVARHRIAAGRLSDAMKKQRISKSYLAVLDGEMPIGEGEINACLHRTAQSIIVREVCSPDAPDAAPALTRYRVITAQNGHTLVKAYPLTGRTHQLRVHFASIGHPITGDDLYGSPSDAIERHALHAHTLTFPHPTIQEEQTVTAPLPPDMARLIRKLFPDLGKL